MDTGRGKTGHPVDGGPLDRRWSRRARRPRHGHSEHVPPAGGCGADATSSTWTRHPHPRFPGAERGRTAAAGNARATVPGSRRLSSAQVKASAVNDRGLARMAHGGRPYRNRGECGTIRSGPTGSVLRARGESRCRLHAPAGKRESNPPSSISGLFRCRSCAPWTAANCAKHCDTRRNGFRIFR